MIGRLTIELGSCRNEMEKDYIQKRLADARKIPKLTNDDLPNIVNGVMFDSLEE